MKNFTDALRSEKTTVQHHFRFTEVEAAKLRQEAEALGVSQTRLVRAIVNNYFETKGDTINV